MGLDGLYYGQDIAWLKQHQLELRNALSAIALGKTVVIAGRQISREDYDKVATALSAVTAEINRQTAITNGTTDNTSQRVAYSNFYGASITQ
jgi:biotin synthase-like enzyme